MMSKFPACGIEKLILSRKIESTVEETDLERKTMRSVLDNNASKVSMNS